MERGFRPHPAARSQLKDTAETVAAAVSRYAVEISLRVEDKEAGRKPSVAAIEFVNQIFSPATVGVGRQLPSGAASLAASFQTAIPGCPIQIALMVKNYFALGEVPVTIVGIELVQDLVGLRPDARRYRNKNQDRQNCVSGAWQSRARHVLNPRSNHNSEPTWEAQILPLNPCQADIPQRL